MFRVVVGVLSGALLLALASTLAGRGSLEQFDRTVVPSVWTLAVAAAAGAWAFALRGTRDPWIRAACAGLGLVLLSVGPVATLSVLAAGLGLDVASRKLRPIAPAAIVGVALVALLQLPAFWFGLMLNDSDVVRAKAYCEAFVPTLENHYQRTGIYPKALRQLPVELGRLPRLLDPQAFYTVDGNRFHFSFRDPSGLERGLCYDSRIGSWRKWAPAAPLALARR